MKPNQAIRELRKITGQTQGEFAAMIGAAKDVLASWEIGRSNLSRSLARRIAFAIGADPGSASEMPALGEGRWGWDGDEVDSAGRLEIASSPDSAFVRSPLFQVNRLEESPVDPAPQQATQQRGEDVNGQPTVAVHLKRESAPACAAPSHGRD
jgi:transcriptional regulator with XRE-family HTH domain